VTGLERELLISTGMALLMVLTHLVGLNLLTRLTRVHVTRFATPVHVDRVLVPLGMVLGIFVIHGVEMWAYALLYLGSGAAPDLESALYFSIGAYTSSGWVDVHLTPGWRVVMSLEAITGLLMIGWSTAFFFHNLNRLMLTAETHPLPEGAIAKEPQKPKAPLHARRG
jgi:hypothetical protein